MTLSGSNNQSILLRIARWIARFTLHPSYFPDSQYALILNNSMNIFRESRNILTLEWGELSHFTGTSFTLNPSFSARNRISTSKLKPLMRLFLKSLFATSPLNNLNPHCVSLNPPITRDLTSRLNVFPILSLYHGCLTTMSDSRSPREPMTISNPLCRNGRSFSSSSIGADVRNLSVKEGFPTLRLRRLAGMT